MGRKLARALDAVLKLFEYVCLLLLVGMVCIAVYSFIARYFFNKAPQWGEPLAAMCFVWVALLSSALAIAKGTHIRIELLDRICSPLIIKMLDTLVYLGIAAFAIFMITTGMAGVQLTVRNIMPSLGIKTAWLYAAVPVTGVLSCLALLRRALDFFQPSKEGNYEQ